MAIVFLFTEMECFLHWVFKILYSSAKWLSATVWGHDTAPPSWCFYRKKIFTMIFKTNPTTNLFKLLILWLVLFILLLPLFHTNKLYFFKVSYKEMIQDPCKKSQYDLLNVHIILHPYVKISSHNRYQNLMIIQL